MVELFSLEGLQKKAAIFDPKKLQWMNGQHLSLRSAIDLEPVVTRDIVAAGLATPEELTKRRDWYLALIDLLKVRARTVHDMVRQAVPYFAPAIEYDAEAVSKQWKDAAASVETLREVRERLSTLESWSPGPMESSLRALAEERGVAAGRLFQPLRLALTGMTVSPGIFEVLVAMGRDRSLERIDQAIRYLGNGANS
jgi:glutamyl-tRNA synthetase